MANAVPIFDSLKNLFSGLNSDRDKQAHAFYALRCLTYEQLSNLYRTSWLGKKAVDIPAQDATRNWREWQADAEQIKAIEAEEARLKVPQRIKTGMQQGRLFGGAGVYASIRGDDPILPLNPNTVQQGQIDFLTVLSRQALTAGDIENDPLRQGYGKPKWYEVSSETAGQQRIHPSRLVLFDGVPILDSENLTQNAYQGWGDSVLQSAYDAVQNADATAENIASLVYEAKVDVLSIPGLGQIMQDEHSREALIERVKLAAALKGNNGMLIIDGEEEHTSKSFTFAGLPDINRDALQAVSGAADIPITRFLGQTPSGLSSTGEADLKNYYDSVRSMQTLILTPAMSVLDEALIRSALGTRPPEVSFEWTSLWQMDDGEKSKISKETAETIKTLWETRLFPDEALSAAAATVLVEKSILPSFELVEESEGAAGERPEDAGV